MPPKNYIQHPPYKMPPGRHIIAKEIIGPKTAWRNKIKVLDRESGYKKWETIIITMN